MIESTRSAEGAEPARPNRSARVRAGRTREFDPANFDTVFAAARNGDGAAFQQLYSWLAQPITAFVSSKGLADPGPVVNETFLGAFRGLDRFSGDATDFRRWVFGIARHKIVDARRSEGRRNERSIDEINLRDRASSVNVEGEALASLSADAVRALCADLTEEQREVLVLRLVSGLTVQQIADLIGKPLGAVKALQRRAIRRLQATADLGQVRA